MTPMKKFKVVSDGTIEGTKIYAPNGEVFGQVQKLVLTFDCNEKLVQAEASIVLPEIEVEILEESFVKKEVSQ
jgi:hypothetical protein